MTPTTAPARAPTTFSPRPIRWTCVEFHHFGDLGLFEGRRTLLIDGVLLEQGPMNPPHAITLEIIDEVIRAIFGTGWRVRCQMPMILGQYTDPVPDIAVVAGTVRGAVGHPTTAELVVEVADTSLRYDTTEKRLLYAAAGVREYWVVDVNARELLVFRDPQQGTGQPATVDYSTTMTLKPSDTISPLGASTTVIHVADLLN